MEIDKELKTGTPEKVNENFNTERVNDFENNQIQNHRTMRSTMVSNYGDEKFNKKKELNKNMTIKRQEPDDYTRTLYSLGKEGL